MEAANLPNPEPARSATHSGELVVQNGRQAGARRPLTAPTTLLGRTTQCDIRLSVKGVDPVHCIFIDTPNGIQVRDLNSAQGTFVNDARVESALLQNGDLLTIGSLQFRLEHLTPSASARDERLHDALRIQTAAVAAQQIALDEHEARLEQRRQDLQQQEEQLAAHLDEKQQQIQLSSEHTRAEKEALRQEKLDFAKQQAHLEQHWADAQTELAKDRQLVKQERQRIDKVYKRFKERWKLQWSAERVKHQQQAKHLQDEIQRLEEQRKAFGIQHGDFAQEKIRFNTERELCLRELRDGRERLATDQARWRQRCAMERRALRLQRQEIDLAHHTLAQARQLIRADRDAWAQQQALLQKELVGLNNRIVNHRIQLQELESAIADHLAETPHRTQASDGVAFITESAAALPFAIPMDDEDGHQDAVIAILLGELADQRLHLLEQYDRLATIQEHWQRQRDYAAADLEALTHRLSEREQSLDLRDEHTTAQEQRLAQRQEELESLRQEIQIWHAQVNAREQLFNNEHAKQLLELREREQSLEGQLASLVELRHRWNDRRQQEIGRQRTLRTRLAAQQIELNELRASLLTESQQVEQEKRILAEKTLALEQYREELFARANDPNAQRRVERLRRRWLALNADSIRNARRERNAVNKELERLDDLHTELAQESSRLEQLDTDLAEKQAALEERGVHLQAIEVRLQQENQRLGNLERQAERRFLRLEDEVEMLAKTMLDEPLDQAA
jgi:hypothetical protein